MSSAAVAEARLAEAQDELDKNPHSRPAQRDYEAKLADWEKCKPDLADVQVGED